ncbi:MAG TPA: sulfatase-like hydrolase/transferase, partial [Gammaproteobacteria bacterium]|nr:sulfatase-like hydrolase/transferase [Gammaproteobacteria bacterium]
THVPFGSDYPYYLRYSDPAYQGEAKFVMARLNEPEEIIRKQEAPSDAFDIPQIVNLYDGCVKSFDDLVGRVTDSLQKAGLAENTIIVLYSDHGLDFFENETWGQGNTVFGDDPGSRIPVVIADPRALSHGRVREVVRSIDIMPTLLSLVGLPAPDTADGASLAETVRHGAPPPGLDAFAETGLWLGRIQGMDPDHITYPGLFELLEIKDRRTGTLSIKDEYGPVIAEAKDRMIRRGRWKLIRVALRQGPRYRLYDVEQDPLCERDLALEYPEIVAELGARLDEWTARDRLVRRAATEEGVARSAMGCRVGVQSSAT